MLNANDGSKIFNEDATFCPEAGLNRQGNSLRSWNYPTRYWRHYNGILYIASNGGPQDYDSIFFCSMMMSASELAASLLDWV